MIVCSVIVLGSGIDCIGLLCDGQEIFSVLIVVNYDCELPTIAVLWDKLLCICTVSYT